MDKMNILRVLCRKTISPDTGLPLLVVPLYFLVAPMGAYSTLFSSTLSVLILYLQAAHTSTDHHCAKIIYTWNVMFFVVFQCVFTYSVVPSLNILWEELLLSCSITCITVGCFWMTKRIDEKNKNTLVHHYDYCLWLKCNIIESNIEPFLLGLFTGVWNALYQINLIWKTLCHPYTWVGNFIIPDDCSSAYTSYDLALLFIHSLYCIIVAMCCTALLVLQILSTNFEEAERKKKIRRISAKENLPRTSVI